MNSWTPIFRKRGGRLSEKENDEESTNLGLKKRGGI